MKSHQNHNNMYNTTHNIQKKSKLWTLYTEKKKINFCTTKKINEALERTEAFATMSDYLLQDNPLTKTLMLLCFYCFYVDSFILSQIHIVVFDVHTIIYIMIIQYNIYYVQDTNIQI